MLASCARHILELGPVRRQPALDKIAKMPGVGAVTSPYAGARMGGADQPRRQIAYAQLFAKRANEVPKDLVQNVLDTAQCAERTGLHIELGCQAIQRVIRARPHGTQHFADCRLSIPVTCNRRERILYSEKLPSARTDVALSGGETLSLLNEDRSLGSESLDPVYAAATVTALDHIRLDVADIDVAERFYADALGLSRVVRYELADHVIQQMAPDGRPAGVELWQERNLVPNPHPTHHVAFRVADVPALVEHIRALGYRVITEPYRIEQETVAFVADPDRHTIELNDFQGRPTVGALA
ncbi:VOC family protein [Streptomyces sp. NPDC094149]|uniref:VOC family protein n=1 Tax=Streptomyces sp. NPDC094149 TaxID=3155079 RepID=UPI003331B34B